MTSTGGCLCGAVRFTIASEMREVSFCHCKQCRKQTGFYLASIGATDAELSVEGGDHVRWYASSEDAKRGFCDRCGSILFWKRDGSEHTSITAGALDDGSVLQPKRHIFVENKPDWYTVSDGLPRYARSSRNAEPLAE